MQICDYTINVKSKIYRNWILLTLSQSHTGGLRSAGLTDPQKTFFLSVAPNLCTHYSPCAANTGTANISGHDHLITSFILTDNSDRSCPSSSAFIRAWQPSQHPWNWTNCFASLALKQSPLISSRMPPVRGLFQATSSSGLSAASYEAALILAVLSGSLRLGMGDSTGPEMSEKSIVGLLRERAALSGRFVEAESGSRLAIGSRSLDPLAPSRPSGWLTESSPSASCWCGSLAEGS